MLQGSARFEWRTAIVRAIPQMVVGGFIGAGALVLAFRHVDWLAVRNALSQCNPRLLLLAVGSVAASLVMNATRWWLLFSPDHRRLNWFSLAGAILIGQTVNIVIPARLGELARVYLVGSREGVSKIRVMGTIIVEKVADLAFFALCVAVLLFGASLPEWVSRSGYGVMVISAILVVAAFGLAFWGGRLLQLVERAARRLPERWAHRVAALAHAAFAGLASLRDWRIVALVWLLSGAVLFFSVTTILIVFKAIHLPLGGLAALFLLVILRIGEAPPSLPGKLGLFQYLIVVALGVFGISRTDAVSYAFALYGVAVLPVLAAGLASILTFRWSRTETQL